MEFPYLTGISEYPAPDVDVGGGLMSLASPLYPRGPVNLSDWLRELPADGGGISALAQLPGWQVLHTPGHSPGHVSFYRPDDRALIVGDAFCTTKPESFFEVALAQQPELHGPPSYFTSNWEHAGRSVQRLARAGAEDRVSRTRKTAGWRVCRASITSAGGRVWAAGGCGEEGGVRKPR